MFVFKEELSTFFGLLSCSSIRELLTRDSCYMLADNYLLAMVFVYFKRAQLSLDEYDEKNFWLALYLAHDQEEDEDQLKWELLPWALGPSLQAGCQQWMEAKDLLWRRMNYRSMVCRSQCDQIMAISVSSPVWDRVRSSCHGGARRRPGQEDEVFYPAGPGNPLPVCRKCPTRVE